MGIWLLCQSALKINRFINLLPANMERATVMVKKNGVLVLLSLYLLCSISYAVSPFGNPTAIGWTTFMGEAGMDILICIFSLQIYNSTDGKRRLLFGVIAGAFFCEIFADGAYNLIQNVFGISNPSIVISSLYEIPFLSFLCLQVWVWWELFAEANADNKRKRMPLLTYSPFITSSLLVIAIFIYFADWKIGRFSGEGLYQLADILAEAAGFALVSICLGTSGNKALSCIAIGFLVIVCSNYMIRLPVVALATKQNSLYEFTWIAGQLLVFYGLSRLKKDNPDNPPENWCYGINCLQSQIAVGSFGLGLLAIALFSIFVKYATSATLPDGSLLKYLPPIMIILSIITVILSSYFSKRLLKPLKELEAAIETYSSHGKFESKLNSHDDYGIREYVELKAFIKKALLSLNEKLTIERETSVLAAGVSHDIASPLAVMDMTLHAHGEQLPANTKSILKDCIQRIRNITHTLLEKYRSPTNAMAPAILNESYMNGGENQTPCPVLLQHITEWAVSQKRIEWAAQTCEITLRVQLNANAGWVFIVPENLKRIISNLLNNAYEALQTKRQIDITVGKEQNSLLYLLISDFGCGIASEYVPRVLEGESLKHTGRGLGLSGAKAYIESLGGELVFTSSVGEGTQVKLLFPQALIPSWFPENILLHGNAPVVVLDDDESMCSFWREHLKMHGVDIFLFTQVDTLLDWCSANPEILSQAIYLFDYHLRDRLWTGLTLLEKLRAGARGYLVTSGADENAIRKRCVELGIWLIPKGLAREIPLKINDSLLPIFP